MGNWQALLKEGHVFGRGLCDITLPGGNRCRGVIRVDEFLQAGVNMALAPNNIWDAARPFGNGDLPRAVLLAAQILRCGRVGRLGAPAAQGGNACSL